jgi:hypothetical protein
MGDFNAKIGDASSEVGLFEDFIFLRPEKSAKATLDLQGKFLLEAMSAGDFMLCPIEDVNGVYPVTCKANADRASATGGSVIDFIFASLPFVEFLGSSSFAFEREISSHAWLEVVIKTPEQCATPTNSPNPPPPPRTVMAFDLDRVFSFEHGEGLIGLVNSPSGFTVREAYDMINNFVAGFTHTEVRQASGTVRVDPLDKRLQRLRAKSRQIKRKLLKASDPDTVAILEERMRQAMQVWKSEREAVRQEKLTRVRERFHEARRNDQFHLAWKLARLNLGGKARGVRTAVTTAIDRQDWESHFSNLFCQTGSRLGQLDAGTTMNEAFDDPITHKEVTAALVKKKNMRAPGPDGFRWTS